MVVDAAELERGANAQAVDRAHPQVYRRQVASLLRTDLHTLGLAPGDRLPSLRELAHRYGVSIGTVSKAIGDLEEENLVVCRPQVGTFVASRGGSAEAGFSSRLVVLLTTFDEDPSRIDPSNTFWQSITSLLMVICRRRGYEVLHSAVSSEERDPTRLLPKLIQDRQGPVGLIYQGSNLDQLAAIRELSLPTVFPHCMWSKEHALARVCLDGYQTASRAVEYLVDRGHREIGYIGPMQADAGVVDSLKFDGYCQAMASAGLSVRSECCWPSLPTLTGAQRVCGAMVPTIKRMPSAFVAANDLVAIGLIGAMRERQLLCPDDVAVVGCDNLEIAAHFTPSLTTFDFDRHHFAEAVVDMLSRRIKHPKSDPKNQFIEMSFVRRQSA